MSNQEVEVLEAEDSYSSVAEELKDALIISLRNVRDAESIEQVLGEADRAKSICNLANSICNISKTQVLLQNHNIRVGIPVTKIELEG